MFAEPKEKQKKQMFNIDQLIPDSDPDPSSIFDRELYNLGEEKPQKVEKTEPAKPMFSLEELIEGICSKFFIFFNEKYHFSFELSLIFR